MSYAARRLAEELSLKRIYVNTFGRRVLIDGSSVPEPDFLDLSAFVEVFVWSQLKTRGAFDDVAWHVTINPGKKGRISEFDVLVAHDGRLFSIDCKAGIKVGTRLSDDIAKTDSSCRRVGRLLSRWMIYVNQDRADFAEQIVELQRPSHSAFAEEEALPQEKIRARRKDYRESGSPAEGVFREPRLAG